MALIVEDGIGRPDAQTFATVSYLKAYAKARGLTVPSGEPDCERLLIVGMDAMRGLDYIGERATKAQALDWPRLNVKIDGFCYASTELPRELPDGQCALAIEAQTTDLLPTTQVNASGPVVSETVGPISVQYAESGRVATRPIIEKAKIHLRKLLRGGGDSLRVVRA